MNKIILNLKFLVFFLIPFFNFGCTKQTEKKPDTLVIAISSIPSTLDPRFALDSEGMKIGSLIFQSLVKIGPDMNLVGDAATSWELKTLKNKKNELSFKLIFELKKNLYFSNGLEVMCSDILFSINEYQSENSPFKSAFKNITSKDCQDHQLIMTFDSYSEKVLNSDLPVIKILPQKNVLEHKDGFKSNLIGSGPYRVVDVKETKINLARNPNFSEQPNIPNLQFKVIKDDFTRFLKMYKGDIDLAVSSMPKNKVQTLEKVKHLNVIKNPGLSMAYLLLNFKNKELSVLSNRELIFNAINRKEIIKYKLEGLAQPATSILTPINPYFLEAFKDYSKPKVSFNTLRQKALKSELSKIVLNLKTSNTREAVENAKLIAKQLRKVGLQVKHQSFEWGTYYKDIKQGNYDLATMTWVGAYDPDIYRIALASNELPPDGRNRGYYENKIFDKLTLQGMNELDPEKRKHIYSQVQKIAFEDLAIIPLWYEDSVTIIDKRVKHYEPSLNGDYSGLLKARLTED